MVTGPGSGECRLTVSHEERFPSASPAFRPTVEPQRGSSWDCETVTRRHLDGVYVHHRRSILRSLPAGRNARLAECYRAYFKDYGPLWIANQARIADTSMEHSVTYLDTTPACCYDVRLHAIKLHGRGFFMQSLLGAMLGIPYLLPSDREPGTVR